MLYGLEDDHDDSVADFPSPASVEWNKSVSNEPFLDDSTDDIKQDSNYRQSETLFSHTGSPVLSNPMALSSFSSENKSVTFSNVNLPSPYRSNSQCTDNGRVYEDISDAEDYAENTGTNRIDPPQDRSHVIDLTADSSDGKSAQLFKNDLLMSL